MDVQHLAALLVPLVVIAVLWTLVRHWILPFVLGFALAVVLGPSARPLVTGAWAAVVQMGDAVFGDPEPAPSAWPTDRRDRRWEQFEEN